ncbi:MAG TPA: SidA/IucD/PvdA family monooxygenase [Candidatus Dormibacteraeota bacterium]|nr:SidA/IucD/PvdA family monooxygenase [Candidatus Dormibacteraeota bacterium]
MPLDAIGVGVGPANLSLAALLTPTDYNARFFERSSEFQWHPGFLFPEAVLQVSYLKDLVTLVDPTSAYTFLAFLHAQKRIYRFINLSAPRVSRMEFNQYLQWVAGRLPNVEFGAEVREVSLSGERFSVRVDGRTLDTTNIVLGTGLVPNIPDWARPYLGTEVFHSIDYLDYPQDVTGKAVAVVGGGQSGAEVVWHLLLDTARLPAQLLWISHRPNFLPLDESPFTNELFTPAYADYFFGLSAEQRGILLAEQRLASDGVSQPLLQRIYDRLYDLEFLERRTSGGRGSSRLVRLFPGHEVVDIRRGSSGCDLGLRSRWGTSQRVRADVVVLGTGFSYELPAAMQPLGDRMRWDRDGFPVRSDFSIEWDGPPGLRVYAQDAARHMRGVADPNLSLVAWRSAIIANSLLGREVYDVGGESSVFDFDALR